MRLIFAGTPPFAERALRALLAAGHEVALVLTRADQPAGRGRLVQASPVKQLALEAGLAVLQPRTLRDGEVQQSIGAVGADAMVVAAYGLILPPEVLALPRYGCLNIHASLLPRWRGAAPIQRAIEAGDTRTGITIMQMDAGLDTGPMLLARAVPIEPDDTGGRLHDRLAALGAALIVEALDGLSRGTLAPVPQPAEGATYARKLEKADELLDWRLSALRLADRVRAFDPFPGCATRLERAPQAALKVWRAVAAPGVLGAAHPGASADAVGQAEPRAGAADVVRQAGDGGPTQNAVPGTVLGADEESVWVACGQGMLRLLELQRAGGRRLAARDFLRGCPIATGERFV